MTLALKNKAPVVIPPAAMRRAGFRNGQELEVKVSGGVIRILPKVPSALHAPATDDEYTPAQRRRIDARLKKALVEVQRGQTAGPFDSAEEMIASLKKELKKGTGKKS